MGLRHRPEFARTNAGNCAYRPRLELRHGCRCDDRSASTEPDRTETGRTAYLGAAVASQAEPGLELSTATRIVFYKGLNVPERIDRYGEVARQLRSA